MISRKNITVWRTIAPWITNEQVELDLVISRAMVEIFSDEYLKEDLAFRGGTENKLHDPEFQKDISGLLRPGIKFDFNEAWDYLRIKLVENMT